MTQLATNEEKKPNRIEMGAVTNFVGPKVKPQTGLRRFQLSDFEQMAGYVSGRLRERYPDMTEKKFVGWATGVMNANEFLFVRNNNAVGLAVEMRDPLSGALQVEELFVFAIAPEDGIEIYQQFKIWAKGKGAKKIIVRTFSDVPSKDIAKAIGKTELETVMTVAV